MAEHHQHRFVDHSWRARLRRAARRPLPRSCSLVLAEDQASETRMTYRLSVVHSFDILGTKVGASRPLCATSFLMIGVDSTGKRPLGRMTSEAFRGKRFDFLPILHYPEDKAREAAKRIKDSINSHFMQALVRYLPAVRRALKEKPTSVDLQRVEYATIVRGMGVPFVQMLHGEGAP